MDPVSSAGKQEFGVKRGKQAAGAKGGKREIPENKHAYFYIFIVVISCIKQE